MANTNLRELQQRAKGAAVKDMGGTNVQQFFEGNRSAIEAALPRHMNAERMLKIAMHAIRTTPQLMECNTASLMGAVIQCSQLGLEPNTVLGHAYLIPFNNRNKGIKEVQVIPGYKGLIDLARRSGQIKTIEAYPVFREEVDAGAVEVRRGTDGFIRHEMLFDFEPERGTLVGAYAVAHFVGGGYQFEFMTVGQINTIRDRSQGYQSAIRYKRDHPWITDYLQMVRKSPIRRLSNYLPLSIEFATATALENQADRGESQALDGVLTGEYTTHDPEAPPAEEEPPAAGEAQSTPPADDPEAYIARIKAATTLDSLDEVMAEATDTLGGSDKARVTKAYNAAKEQLDNDDSAAGAFGG